MNMKHLLVAVCFVGSILFCWGYSAGESSVIIGDGPGVTYGDLESRESMVVWKTETGYKLEVRVYGPPTTDTQLRGDVIAAVVTEFNQEVADWLRDRLEE